MLVGVHDRVVFVDRACPVHKDPMFITDEAGLVPTHPDFYGSQRCHAIMHIDQHAAPLRININMFMTVPLLCRTLARESGDIWDCGP